ncbi:MAG: DUF4116 domain-containing protein [Betaproteobacteria bacterium]|nr:DUF4116 domain-containing protein [Betaproteobacteria bacterium]
MSQQQMNAAKQQGESTLSNGIDPFQDLIDEIVENYWKIDFGMDDEVFENLKLSELLQQNRAYAEWLMHVNPKCFQLLSENFRDDNLFACRALERSPEIFEYASYRLRDHPKFVYHALNLANGYGDTAADILKHVGKTIADVLDFVVGADSKTFNDVDYLLDILKNFETHAEKMALEEKVPKKNDGSIGPVKI